MTSVLDAEAIAAAYLAACRAELQALKPGNVHVHGDGHRMTVEMFEAAATASAPHVAALRGPLEAGVETGIETGASVGARIERAVAASVAATGCNANLGIVLLCVPLAVAAAAADGPLRVRVDRVLDALTVEDAAAAYRAIAHAGPAGLGTAPIHDVTAGPPSVDLLTAMTAAREHDRIAAAYADDFHEVFDFALPCLTTARLSAPREAMAITTLHMALLAQFPDSHIARKHGLDTARGVMAEAHRLRMVWQPAVDTDDDLATLLAFDIDLKRRDLNPGTTADMVVATLFLDRLIAAERHARSGG